MKNKLFVAYISVTAILCIPSIGSTMETPEQQLLQAAAHGDLRKVMSALRRGATIDHQDRYGRTALLEAARWHKLPIMAYLVEHGANKDHQDNTGITALISTVVLGGLSMAAYLVEHGVNINHQDNKGNTALIVAARRKRLDMATYLIEHGANINHHNNSDETALVIATKWEHFPIAAPNRAHVPLIIYLLLYDQSHKRITRDLELFEKIGLHLLSQNSILHTEQDDRTQAIQAHIQDLRSNQQEYKKQLPQALGYALGKPDLVTYLLQHVSPHARLCDYSPVLVTPITILQTILRQSHLTDEQREAYSTTQTLLAQAAAMRMRLVTRLLSSKIPDELGEHVFMFMHPEYSPEFITLVRKDMI